MLMSDLISLEHVKPSRVERCLSRMVNMSKKGSELSELISAWSWAVGSFKSSNSNLNRINLDYQSTARAAQRLRAMRSDLMLLLNNIPEDQIKPKEQNDSESQLFDKNTNAFTSADNQLNAQILEPTNDKIGESQYNDYE